MQTTKGNFKELVLDYLKNRPDEVISLGEIWATYSDIPKALMWAVEELENEGRIEILEETIDGIMGLRYI